MMNIPMPRTRLSFRRPVVTAHMAEPAPYIAPERKRDDEAEALRRILREHAARWR
jgi:hypothetical protein